MTETEGQQMLDPVKIDTFDRPRLGNPDAPIEIVVFSDFQCPYCKMAAGTLKQVYEDNKDNVTLVFKHFPLSFHELAAPAALIAEAGHNDGKFWEIHDYFFENQSNLSPEMIASAVTKFGFNLNETFNSLTGKMLSDQIAKDFDDGKAANIPGTPAIFINGVFIEGGSSQIRLQMRISAEMSYENEMAAKDVPSDSPYPEFKAPYGELSNLQRKRLLSIAGDSPCPCDKPEQSLHQCAIENSCPEIAPRLEKLFQGIRENHSTMEIIRDLK